MHCHRVELFRTCPRFSADAVLRSAPISPVYSIWHRNKRHLVQIFRFSQQSAFAQSCIARFPLGGVHLHTRSPLSVPLLEICSSANPAALFFWISIQTIKLSQLSITEGTDLSLILQSSYGGRGVGNGQIRSRRAVSFLGESLTRLPLPELYGRTPEKRDPGEITDFGGCVPGKGTGRQTNG